MKSGVGECIDKRAPERGAEFLQNLDGSRYGFLLPLLKPLIPFDELLGRFDFSPHEVVISRNVYNTSVVPALNWSPQTANSQPPRRRWTKMRKGPGMYSIWCVGCGSIIGDGLSTPVDDQVRCPSCPSTRRFVALDAHDSCVIQVHEQVHLKDRQGTGRKALREVKSGDDFHRQSGRWNKIERVIDHRNDWYDEVIIDPSTGSVIREVHEPLSKHQGHGSAKWAKRKQK